MTTEDSLYLILITNITENNGEQMNVARIFELAETANDIELYWLFNQLTSEPSPSPERVSDIQTFHRLYGKKIVATVCAWVAMTSFFLGYLLRSQESKLNIISKIFTYDKSYVNTNITKTNP